jgi:hypothetical protein
MAEELTPPAMSSLLDSIGMRECLKHLSLNAYGSNIIIFLSYCLHQLCMMKEEVAAIYMVSDGLALRQQQ